MGKDMKLGHYFTKIVMSSKNGNNFKFEGLKTGCDTCSRNFDFAFDEFS